MWRNHSFLSMFIDTEEEKKSLLYTTLLFAGMFLLFFLLKYTTEPNLLDLEGGGGGGDIAVNFGNSDLGMGDNFESVELASATPKFVPPTPSVEKEIVVSENDDAPAVVEAKKPAEKTKKVEETKPVVKPTPKPSKSTQSALDNLLNGTDNSGDGTDNVGGNKGKAYGNPNDRGYDGGGGSGTGSGGGNGSGQGIGTGSGYGSGSGSGKGGGNGNYMLAGRKNLNKPQPEYTCNEQGAVAVKIWVDRQGNVVKAESGDRGTTNAAQCLATQAVIAAKKTKWQPNENAAELQVGKIIYNFKLTD